MKDPEKALEEAQLSSLLKLDRLMEEESELFESETTVRA
jgi:hypothetical protein